MMQTNTQSDTGEIRVVIFKDGDQWVGQCLEYDIGAQAADLSTLHERLQVVLAAENKESLSRIGKPFGGIDPAPAYYHKLWERSLRMTLDSGDKKESNGTPQLQLAIAA